jgi:hypothetical protein
MMGHINFKDHALIKRQRASKKMNAMSGTFKDEKDRVIVESVSHTDTTMCGSLNF